MVVIFGPEESRPFTQSVHAFVGVGFVVGSFLATPFLPHEEKVRFEFFKVNYSNFCLLRKGSFQILSTT
jgi:hypothetical protein